MTLPLCHLFFSLLHRGQTASVISLPDEGKKTFPACPVFPVDIVFSALLRYTVQENAALRMPRYAKGVKDR